MEETFTIATNNSEPTYITLINGKCIGGHTWTYSGRDINLEGQLCDCGMVKYEKPNYCDKCGHQIINP